MAVVFSSLLAMSLFVACDGIDHGDATPTPTAASEAVAAIPIHWTYEGEEGPEHWGELAEAYAACSEGDSQSPIDFSATVEQDLTNISFDYSPSAVNILNNGHTIQVQYDSGSSISVNDTRYDLLQFHLHSPSEHTIDGEAYAAELHLVHQSADGTLAVVGLLIDTGEENTALAPVWEHLPAESGPVQTKDATVNAADMLPSDRTTFRYDGSLTTPDCREGVVWMVMTEPISISDAQLSEFTEIIHENNRPVQPLNDREILEDTSP